MGVIESAPFFLNGQPRTASWHNTHLKIQTNYVGTQYVLQETRTEKPGRLSTHTNKLYLSLSRLVSI